MIFFFFKQKTAYEMRISDWSSDGCSSDLRGGNAGKLKPKDVVAGYIKAKGNTSVKSGNRLTLLRDGDGDGSYELKTVFADKLNAPYGLALVGNTLYVANQDALV